MSEARSFRVLTWQKAARSQAAGYCVEVARCEDRVAVRDSKSPELGALLYTKAEFAAFVDGCRRGEFDHLL
jgi:hypothetical protein